MWVVVGSRINPECGEGAWYLIIIRVLDKLLSDENITGWTQIDGICVGREPEC